MRSLFTLSLLLFNLCLHATELKPWFGNVKELDLRASYIFQNYHDVSTKFGTVHHYSGDSYLNLSAAMTFTDFIYGEFEVLSGRTAQHDFGVDHERLTARYLFLNDVIGDPVSLAAGVSFTHVHTPALDDISNFYHGHYEYEAIASIGKETICREFWMNRWWGIFGLGVASKGSPWIRSEIAWEKNFWGEKEFGIFANSLWGLGDRGLNLEVPFHGYDSIKHQSVDLGARARFLLPCPDVYFTIQYSRRVYALNAPKNNNILLFSIFYNMGIGSIPGIGIISPLTKGFNPLQ